MISSRDRVIASVSRLEDALIVDIVRRAGVRATSDTSSAKGPRSRGSHSDPTLLAVVREMAGKAIQDPIWEASRELARLLNDMARMSAQVDDKIRFITGGAQRVKEYAIAHCCACARVVACTPKDRLRSGYCMACWAAWKRAGRPYRTQFELERRERAASDT